MQKFEVYPANVIDNADPLKSGRVKIKIDYKMEQVSENILPWVSPFHLGGGSEKNKLSFIPEIGEKIYVFFLDDTYFRNGRYIADMVFDKKGTHNESIGSMEGMYPNLKFLKLKNGVSIALNSDKTEATIVAGDAEIFINKNGEVLVKGAKAEIEADEITLNSGDATPWKPCVIQTCPIAGFPHGGPPAGIVKLKGK